LVQQVLGLLHPVGLLVGLVVVLLLCLLLHLPPLGVLLLLGMASILVVAGLLRWFT